MEKYSKNATAIGDDEKLNSAAGGTAADPGIEEVIEDFLNGSIADAAQVIVRENESRDD